jgi:hypothetical protein
MLDGCEALSVDQQKEVEVLLRSHHDIFCQGDEIGLCTWERFKIDTGDTKPFRQKQRPLPYHYQAEVLKIYQDYLRQGVVRFSNSPYASNILCVPKKTGEVRPCVDLRQLNSVTRLDAGPLPRIDAILDGIHG